MIGPIIPGAATHEWVHALYRIINHGETVSPRGKATLELLHQTFCVDMTLPVVTVPTRKLNYSFLAAEAYWILTGDDTVAGIAPFNSHIAQFSDDGEKFAGAYGPRIKEQLPWVVAKLLDDPDTRQAGIIIWKNMPEPSRDIPCTVAIWFTIRQGRLNVHVFMRSSDAWLGLPYDIFNFCMLGWLVAGMLNETEKYWSQPLLPGTMLLTAASSHLYETDLIKAQAIIAESYEIDESRRVPLELAYQPDTLIELLKDLRVNKERRWW